MRYRPEIDGLRALAVTCVILFHAGYGWMAPGFLGVDVFFVISGYLITSLIVQEQAAGIFTLANFYERRVRRILPALLTVCLFCLPFALVWTIPADRRAFFTSLAPVNLFYSNFHFSTVTGYFENNANFLPLLHTWSLAVEEQYYLGAPLLLLLVRKHPHLRLLLALAIVIASLALLAHVEIWRGDELFFMVQGRAWQLGAGSLLALVLPNVPAMPRRLRETGVLLGLMLFAFVQISYGGEEYYPTSWSFFAVAATCCLIMFARNGDTLTRILTFKPVVWIGLISYSAYLWHQPVIAFANMRLYRGILDWQMPLLILLTYILAAATWFLVERPFRNRQFLRRWQLFALCSFVSLSLAVGSNWVLEPRSFPKNMIARISQTFISGTVPRKMNCTGGAKNLVLPEKSCIHGNLANPRLAIFGDSHAGAIAKVLGGALGRHQLGLRELTVSACPVMPDDYPTGAVKDCPRLVKPNWQFLTNDPKTAIVVVLSRWSRWMEGTSFNNGEGGLESSDALYQPLLADDANNSIRRERVRTYTASYQHAVVELLARGKKVVLVYPVPEIGWDVSKFLQREKLFGMRRFLALSTRFDVYYQRNSDAIAALDGIADNPNLLRIYPQNLFCDTFRKDRCVAQVFGQPIYYDDDHLNPMGASILSEHIVTQMRRLGWF